MDTVETEDVLKIALADLRRRLEQSSPVVDAQIEQTLKLCAAELQRRFLIVDQDRLRQVVLELSPELRRDTEHLATLIKELVTFEREKAGFDKPRGTLTLWPNKNKTLSAHPDMLGDGRIAGRQYRVAAWFQGEHNLKVSVLPAQRK
jgi:hypothetical protein